MNLIKIENEFNHDVFGKLTVLKNPQTNEPWFIGREVAEMLGYKDTTQAIRQHCKKTESCPVNLTGQVRATKIISESDLYRLTMKSQLPTAEKFQDWVVEEVLPSIRQTGGYIPAKPEMTEEEIMAKGFEISQRTLARIREQKKLLEIELINKAFIGNHKQVKECAQILNDTWSLFLHERSFRGSDINNILEDNGFVYVSYPKYKKISLTDKGASTTLLREDGTTHARVLVDPAFFNDSDIQLMIYQYIQDNF